MSWAKTHVHDTAVDIAEFLEAKEPRAMSGVIEGVRLDFISLKLINHLRSRIERHTVVA